MQYNTTQGFGHPDATVEVGERVPIALALGRTHDREKSQ